MKVTLGRLLAHYGFIDFHQAIIDGKLDLTDFVDSARRAPADDEDRPVLGWLFRAVSRRSYKMLRARSRRLPRETRFYEESVTRPSSPDRLHAQKLAIARVRAVYKLLPPGRVMLLHYSSSGKTYDEIAGLLEMDKANVGKALTRARRAFRAAYVKLYHGDVVPRAAR